MTDNDKTAQNWQIMLDAVVTNSKI